MNIEKTEPDPGPAESSRRRVWSRREMLGTLAGLVVLPAVPGLFPASSRGVRPLEAGETSNLPPRTVGLRSLGGDFRFDPPGLQIEPGDTVTWLNMGDFHTATSFHPANAHLLEGDVPLRVPEEAEPFHSGMLELDAGTRFEHIFRVPGVHDYFCQPHYGFGMVGRILVGEPENASPAPAEQLVEAARARLPELTTIVGSSGRAFEWTARLNGVLLLRANGADDVSARAARLEESLEDPGLREILEAEGRLEEFRRDLTAFISGAAENDYEDLIRLADEIKSSLRRRRGGPARGTRTPAASFLG